MDDVWFIILNGKVEGPYLFQDLKAIKGLTLDTLAWREGLETWTPVRKIPELIKLFSDNEPPPITLKEIFEGEPGGEGTAMSVPYVEPPSYFWFIFITMIIIYAFLQFYL